MKISLQWIILLFGLVINKVVYKDIKNKEIHPNDLLSHETFYIELEQYRLKLESESYKRGGIKFRKGYCYYSASIENKESYGSFNVCDGIEGTIVVDGMTIEYKSKKDPFDIIIKDNKEAENKEVENKEEDLSSSIIQVKNKSVVIKIDDNIKVKEIELRKRDTKKTIKNDNKEDLDLLNNVYVKIFFINDRDRVEDLKDRIDLDTREVFEEASRILREGFKGKFNINLQFMGSLNIVEGSFYEGFYRKSLGFIPIEKLINNDLKIEKLEYLSQFFPKKRRLFKESNLVVLLTSKDVDEVEGLSFIGGSINRRDGFSTINISETDSVFYKGKVLAHEVLHSLGAQHSSEKDSLMNESFSPIFREKEVKIEDKEVEEFLSKNLDNFKKVGTCGSGYMDGSKECDSGLLNGSECCTRECKLRKDKECDDRNGGCCKGCKFVQKETVCGIPTDNYFFKDCQRQGRCTGSTPECRTILKEDGSDCLQGGVCLRGVCQTPSLWCSRVDRKFEEGCKDPTHLMCLDEKNVCGVVLDSQYRPFLLKE